MHAEGEDAEDGEGRELETDFPGVLRVDGEQGEHRQGKRAEAVGLAAAEAVDHHGEGHAHGPLGGQRHARQPGVAEGGGDEQTLARVPGQAAESHQLRHQPEGQAQVQATDRQQVQEASAVEGIAGGGAALAEEEGGGEILVLPDAVDGAPGEAAETRASRVETRSTRAAMSTGRSPPIGNWSRW